jgi:squalene cyclase
MKDEAVNTLLEAQNADGGWGSLRGRRSNTESTSLAVMALQSLGNRAAAVKAQRGLDWLIDRQNADGSWPLNEMTKGGSWMTAFAMLALANVPEQQQRALAGAQWTLAEEGRRAGVVMDDRFWANPEAAFESCPEGLGLDCGGVQLGGADELFPTGAEEIAPVAERRQG